MLTFLMTLLGERNLSYSSVPLICPSNIKKNLEIVCSLEVIFIYLLKKVDLTLAFILQTLIALLHVHSR